MRTNLLPLLAVLFAASASSGWSQPVPEPPPTTEQPAAPVVTPTPPPPNEVTVKDIDGPHTVVVAKGKDASGKETLSVDFPDEDIRNILRNVADLFELNLIIPEKLQGKASIKLRDVTWRQIFQQVLTPIGYTFKETDNIVSIVSVGEMSAQQESAIITVTSGSLAEAKQAADSIVTQPADLPDGKKSPGGRVILLTNASSLQITDTLEKIAAVRDTLSRLSRANSTTNTRQVLIETKFFDVTNGNIRQLGVRFKQLGATVSGGALQLINGTDISGAFTTAIYDRSSFEAAITALQSDNKIKLVTNPMIVTQQNQKAEIFEKTIIRYFVPVPQAQGGVPSPPDVKEIEVKTGLTVTPSIIDTRDNRGEIVESLIQMQVSPEVSSLGQDDTYSAGGVSITIPRVDTRTTTTHVVLKNGYTLVLGGLVQTQMTKSKTKTPILGDIPVLGILFRQTKDSVEQRTLLTFITARIISPDGSQPESQKNGSPADFAEPAKRALNAQKIRDLELTKQDLPGYLEPEDSNLPEKKKAK